MRTVLCEWPCFAFAVNKAFVLQVRRLGKWEAGKVRFMLETYCEVILEFLWLRATADL